MLNLGTCQLLPQTATITINCSDSSFCTRIHRHDCRCQPFFHSQLTHCPSYHFSWNPINSFLQIHKAKVELLSFNSKILLHLSYGKNCISGSFSFHKSKLHIICLNLLPNSVLKDPFHHFHSMFQQFNFPIRSTLHWMTLNSVSG